MTDNKEKLSDAEFKRELAELIPTCAHLPAACAVMQPSPTTWPRMQC